MTRRTWKLDQKDTICPRPTYTVNCDGSVKTGLVKDFRMTTMYVLISALIYMDLDPIQVITMISNMIKPYLGSRRNPRTD